MSPIFWPVVYILLYLYIFLHGKFFSRYKLTLSKRVSTCVIFSDRFNLIEFDISLNSVNFAICSTVWFAIAIPFGQMKLNHFDIKFNEVEPARPKFYSFLLAKKRGSTHSLKKMYVFSRILIKKSNPKRVSNLFQPIRNGSFDVINSFVLPTLIFQKLTDPSFFDSAKLEILNQNWSERS